VKTYNFKAQFAGPVKRGEKLSTIRAEGKRTPPFAGESLRFYTGMRTKQCRLLGNAVCETCTAIFIGPNFISLGGRMLHPFEKASIARADGFKDEEQLRGWFKDVHGLPFKGWLVTWRAASKPGEDGRKLS
jgi:hypothetical protein